MYHPAFDCVNRFVDRMLLLLVISSLLTFTGSENSGQKSNIGTKKNISCYQCYERIDQPRACNKTQKCEGSWCVKGPDSGGIYRGCMDSIPYPQQKSQCVAVKGDDGAENLNCYCDFDYCNNERRPKLHQFFFIITIICLLV